MADTRWLDRGIVFRIVGRLLTKSAVSARIMASVGVWVMARRTMPIAAIEMHATSKRSILSRRRSLLTAAINAIIRQRPTGRAMMSVKVIVR